MRVYSCFIFLALAGCFGPKTPPAVSAPPFPDEEYFPYSRAGNSIISGQVFSKTVDGQVKLGAGSEVFLEPKTSYSSFINRNNNVTNISSKRDKYRRSTRAGADGTYKFRNLPAGHYYISSSVTWQIPVYTQNYFTGGYDAKMSTQGGRGIQSVTVRNGEVLDDVHVMPFDSSR